MKRTHLSSLFRAAVVGATVAPLAACGGGLLGNSGPDRGGAMERQAIELPAAAVKVSGEPGTFGKTARAALPSDLTTFNPYFQVDASTASVHRQLYATLVEYDPVARDIKKDGGLASYEVKSNKVLVTLRQGLKFSDGTSIDANDLVYSFKVAMDPQVNSPLSDMLSVSGRLPNVRKVDDRSVELEFVDEYKAIGYVLSQMPIISAGEDWQNTIDRGHYEEALGVKTPVEKIACSGPFRVASYAPAKEIVLQYNPHYWRVDAQGRRLPYIDQVKYQIGLPTDAVAKQLKDQKLDIAEFIPSGMASSLGEGQGFAAKDLGVGYSTWQLVMNMRADANTDRVKATWLRNTKFREFVSRLMDRDRMVKEVLGGKGVPAYGPVTAANQFWYNEGITRYGFDRGQALAARDAGMFKVEDRGGKPQLLDVVNRKVSFNLYYPKDDEGEALKNIVVKALGDEGIPINAVAVDAGQLLTKHLMTGNFELALWRSDTPSSDPIAYMPIFMSSGKRHYYLHSEAGKTEPGMEWELEINRLMRQMQAKVLADERKADFLKVQKLWSDNNPVIYLVAGNVTVATATDLGNFNPVALYPYTTWNLEQLYFKQKS